VKLTEEELPFVRTIGDVLERLQIVNEQSLASTSGPTPGPNGLPSNELHSRYIREENESSVKALFQEPPDTALDNVFNLERGMTKRLIMRTLKGVISVIVRAAFRVRIKGLGKIPKKGAVLLCPNHQSYIDPLVIFAILPGWMLDRLMFVALGEIFGRPPLSWLKHPTRIIPTGSAGTLGESLKLSHEGLKRGMSVCIFPEGGRTTTGKIMDPRPGAGILSVETGTPIVPILIEGAINTLSHLNPQFKFAKVQIIIGDPIYPVIERDNMRVRYEYMMDKWKEALLDLESRTSKV
jgi:1-acyl-sn-glycerol-3-phosphate acyltransferase